MSDLADEGDALAQSVERDAHEGYLLARIEALEAEVERLREVLKGLYDECVFHAKVRGGEGYLAAAMAAARAALEEA